MKEKKLQVDEGKEIMIYHVANGYRNTCNLFIAMPNIFGSDSALLSNMIVNGMFGIELYLKFLCVHDHVENIPKTHNIEELFSKKLKENRKKQVFNYLSEKKISERELSSFLKQHKLDFSTYRYPICDDKYSTEIHCIVYLLEALKEMSDKIAITDSKPRNLPEFSGKISKDVIDIAKSEVELFNFNIQ